MVHYNARVSASELSLIQTIRSVKYGEIFSPKVAPGPFDKDVEISMNIRQLLDLIRDGCEVAILTIHQGEPTLAEVDTLINNFRCRKKIKFPAG